MHSQFAAARYTTAPLRSRPGDTAPLVSQLLLGEVVEVIEDRGLHAHVRRPEDGLEAYVPQRHLRAVDAEEYRHQLESPAFALELFGTLMGGDYGVPVTFGARLPAYDGIQLRLGAARYNYTGTALRSADGLVDAALLLRLARRWLHVPELKGGRTPTGIDPAALVQLLYRLAGFRLPTRISDMAPLGGTVDFMQQYQYGDLAFCTAIAGGKPHVGILLPDSRVLHVHGRVRIDAIDHFGIFLHPRSRYTHRLRIVKRWFTDLPAGEGALTSRAPQAVADDRQTFLF